jgi:hypothetical protein
VPVLVCYESIDEPRARLIQLKLSGFGIRTCLDVMAARTSSTEIMTDILRALESCTHLILVVSATTVLSWWAAFAVGVATRSEARLCSFRAGPTVLPDYLRIWPALNYETQIVHFARRYFEDSAHAELNLRQFRQESTSKPLKTADAFHVALRRDLEPMT